jgi:large subunit ribosomal protein L13
MKVIDGKNAVMGRLASYAAKEALKGEEIAIINCGQVIITGNKKFIEKDLLEKREKIGSGQKGPKVSRTSEKIVKRAIRGMLPDHRVGRGREAFKKIKCYTGIPPEFKDSKKISFNDEDKLKYIRVKDISI